MINKSLVGSKRYPIMARPGKFLTSKLETVQIGLSFFFVFGCAIISPFTPSSWVDYVAYTEGMGPSGGGTQCLLRGFHARSSRPPCSRPTGS